MTTRTDSIEFIIRSWIENSDTTPEPIDIETAADYLSWMDKDTVPEGTTAEVIMEVWNRLLTE